MIKIVDYGLGNILALLNVYKRLNIEVSIAKNADDLQSALKVILPGVGAFDHAMELLNRSGMREVLDELVLGKRVPVLGICVGMQILARSSDEGQAPGLGWINGHVKGFKSLQQDELLLPHMGWNDAKPVSNTKLFDQLESNARFYFLHSYYLRCERQEDIAAMSSYGTDFTCAVNVGNIYGVQFHPEKSHHFGAQLLKNFAEL
ncbi:imidazole glycerol phosphate synthase subunit HisH [Acidobacteria bacterium AH-259-O06]|nr:imidazole glycerol phosphate synthase subunit HisH [Acidobacteria bacterium AH-259-O06]